MSSTSSPSAYETADFGTAAQRGLPAWSSALPLWAAERWLWITVESPQSILYRRGGSSGGLEHMAAGHIPTLLLGLPKPYSMIVLDCRTADAPPDDWWPLLKEALMPGGVLFACMIDSGRLPERLHALEPDLNPAGWHLIEPGEDQCWHLRPATSPMRGITSTLNPPYSLRSWLRQMHRRWVPSARRVPCLPVWRAERGAFISKPEISPALHIPHAGLLSQVAGRPLRGPLAMLHTGYPKPERAKHGLLLSEAGASYPFALVKWAYGESAERLRCEQEALAHIRASKDIVLAASCPQSWGPFDAGQDMLVTVERYLPSRAAYAQMRTSLRPKRLVAGHFSRVLTWLTHFTLVTRQTPRPLDGGLLEQYIEAPLLEVAARFGNEAAPRAAVDATIALGREHLGRMVPLVAEHGDLWLSNVLLSRSSDGIYVVDWEHFRPSALPGFDALLFCASYAAEFPWRPFGWAKPGVALTRAFLQPTWLGNYIERFLEHSCAAAGLPPTLLPALLPAAIARLLLRLAGPASNELADLHPHWLFALQTWWRRPADNWLESWARAGAKT